ncbi:methyltransferase domain-containing protein [Coleofasciculus sp. H7-2]|uniref:methyltransferase domain-containing protein n=1 Tax=Coleofasciculus sp. H7-2 TaxID=3351545 RepID=UPI003672A04D
MKCKICESDSINIANTKIMQKYDIDYFQCSNCSFIQTEEPYWLEEAYSEAIASSDVGLLFRNINLSQVSSNIIINHFNHENKFLDYGGGYGVFVRLMRDLGIDFYWYDKFCQNIFAQGFEAEDKENTRYELVTAFEVFEHLVEPIAEIEHILKFSRNILFSTELLPASNPKPNEWWYYSLDEGQHISLYTSKALSIIADNFGLNLYSDGSSLHLLTEKSLSHNWLNSLGGDGQENLQKTSLLQRDYLKSIGKLDDDNNEVKTTEEDNNNADFAAGTKKVKVAIDGVFFQLYQTGIARVWKSLLEEWAKNGFAEYIVVIDRAGTAPKIPGVLYRSVPAYNYSTTDADRAMLQQVCDEEGADLFISTYYTTPLSTPSVFMAYDMIPEVMEWDFNNPMWQEKHYAIQQASAYIAISENTARDLVKFFPHIARESITVAHCGVNKTFLPASIAEVNIFRTKYGISKPYFILVGIGGYKNTILFLKAFALLYSKQGFDIVCTGSGALLDDQFRAYTSGSVVHMLQLSDEELMAAYSGAIALVYPSKYEGFGLPVVEAMACGCPVITCANASIPEVAGKAALYVNDEDINGLANALCEVQKPEVRRSLMSAGMEQAKKFSWETMGRTVSSALIEATLLLLKLKEINLIVFPDWSQPEESLSIDLERVIKAIATHPQKSQMALLVETANISEEDANLVLSSVAMNLIMQEDLDVTEGPEISLTRKLEEIHWKALLPRIYARIVMQNENQQAIAVVKAENIPTCNLDSFSEKRVVQLEMGEWSLQ